MYQFNSKLQTAKLIVARHRVFSSILKEIASSTVSNIFLTDFVFDIDDKDISKINMKGLSASYGAIAQQESILLKKSNFKSVSVSNISLLDKGEISFDVSLTLDSSLLKYRPISLVGSNVNQIQVGSINATSSNSSSIKNNPSDTKTSNSKVNDGLSDVSDSLGDISDISSIDTNLDLDNI